MRKSYFLPFLYLSFLAGLNCFGFINHQKSSEMPPEDYAKEWKNVDSLVDLGLPQSALEVVEIIYKDSKRTANTPHFVKAVIYKLKLQSDYQEDWMIKSIADLKKEIETSVFPVTPILQTMLAEIYWAYYQSNRYYFLNRTETVDFKQDDIKTWDLRKIIGQVIFYYQESLKNAQELKKIQIDMYDAVLEKNYNSENFRPTVFDFLAHRAADFFMNSESGLTQTVDKFEMKDEKLLSTAAEFSKLQISSSDPFSLKYYAILVLQDLIAFHLNDSDPIALIDADLKRLRFIRQNMISEIKDSLYLKTLMSAENQYSSFPASADISYEIANEYKTLGSKYNPILSDAHKWDIKTALEICEKTLDKFPDSDGAGNCAYLMLQILAKSANLNVEYSNVPGIPFKALLTYRNIPQLHLRIIQTDPKKDRRLREKKYDEDLVNEYVSMKAMKEWSIQIPDDGDYQQHSVEIKMPELPMGYYVVLIAADQDFSYVESPISYGNFWATNISYLNREIENNGMEFQMLSRDAGEPIKGLKAEAFLREYNYTIRDYEYKTWRNYESNSDGRFTVPPYKSDRYDYKYYYFDFVNGQDRLITENYFYQYNYYPPDTGWNTKTFYFTDRGIYRPGQTVYFKAIVLETNGTEYRIKPKATISVSLYDVNYQEAGKLELVSNEYGTVNGTFMAPSSGLTGQMYITDGHGSVYFSVEEYKRPKFEVEFQPIKGVFKLNENVTVKGEAKAYAGNSIDGAQVKYRVVRSARFPYWGYWWWGGYPTSASMEITNGTTTTDENGEFIVEFTAITDPGVSKEYKPVFYYTVYADVTDINGETHSSSRGVSVGYTALLASVNLGSQLDRDAVKKFEIYTTNLDGEPEHSEVSIKIFALQAPNKVFRERKWSRPDKFVMTKEEAYNIFPNDLYDDENNIYRWEKGKLLLNITYNTKQDSILNINDLAKWPAGQYVLEISATDRFGEQIETKQYFSVYGTSDKTIPENVVLWHTAIKSYCEPGEKAKFLIGSAAENVRVLYEVELGDRIIDKQWITLNKEQKIIEIPIKEEYRGNISYHITTNYNNRSYQFDNTVWVPFTNKELSLKFESFRDKLLPGQEEEWKIIISGQKGEKIAAEMVATLYDASLDAFRANSWYFSVLKYFYSSRSWQSYYSFTLAQTSSYQKPAEDIPIPVYRYYDHLNWFGFNFGYYYYYPVTVSGGTALPAASYRYTAGEGEYPDGLVAGDIRDAEQSLEEKETSKNVSNITEVDDKVAGRDDNDNGGQGGGIQVRKNFNETAFFIPDLVTNEHGEIIIKFTIPEALTKWKMMGLAHTKDLKFGQITKELVTQKDLMVVPNPPRFFRENDQMTFSAKISNVSDKDLSGEVTLEFFDATTMKSVDDLMKHKVLPKSFIAKAGQSTLAEWDVMIPEGIGAITYRIVAKAGSFSDGEEMAIPVLTNRILVTETLPLPINGNQTKPFTFEKLANSGSSTTLKNFKLTLEFTSNPAWYAIQALPYLMEYPYECSEQIFNRYYANSIASFVVNSNPKIKQVFDAWKNFSPDALLSNLEKNQELKNVLLEETPWVLEAKDESERKQRVALLFDLNTMSNELDRALNKLIKKQVSNGAWSWFDGGPDDRYMTQYIVTGFGHLDHLGVLNNKSDNKVNNMIELAVQYLDNRIREDYEDLKKWYPDGMDKNHIGYTQIQYLYARSYFLDRVILSDNNKEAFEYYKGQTQKYWNESGSIYLQGMIALALHRLEDQTTPANIIKSLKETALHSEEMGMYWRDMQIGYYWYQAPIETQALLIECFDEVANDQKSVEEMKIWLLKQKQTQDWKTTKATAEACYALLLKGTDLLASDKLVEVVIGDEKLDPKSMDGVKVEAGTGYFKTSWSGGDVRPEMGNITVTKTDDGVAWGSLYWQYFEQLDKITPAETPLKLEKKLFREINTDHGPVIEPVTDNINLKVGDKLKVRIELRVDRDMEYVHMKDMRASGFEPVNVISKYKWQGGLGYYESTRDAATNFFFNWLPKGTYVFEYPMFVTHKGDFSNGITTIQCMYAPEFTSHSEGIRVKVVE